MAALKERGFDTVPEPGRRIVIEELRASGIALPWANPKAFAERAVQMARSDLVWADHQTGVVFFDRGLVDAALALTHAGGPAYRDTLGTRRTYSRKVFLAPPWPEIYKTDAERQHGFSEAEAEFQRIATTLPNLGYDIRILPKASVAERIAFVLTELDLLV